MYNNWDISNLETQLHKLQSDTGLAPSLLKVKDSRRLLHYLSIPTLPAGVINTCSSLLGLEVEESHFVEYKHIGEVYDSDGQYIGELLV